MKPIAERSEFFNPVDFPYEVHGFWEEYICAETHRNLGNKALIEPHYPLGSTGMRTWTLVHDLTLTKGFKQVTIKASPQKPRRVITTIQAICGKLKQRP